MNERELLDRLASGSRGPVPDVDALLERAFDGEERAESLPFVPLATAATLALAASASTPAWIEGAPAERERSETLARAVFQAARVLSQELSPEPRDEH